MQTKPATAPELAPNTVGLPFSVRSVKAHAIAPAAAEKCVAAKALLANPSDNMPLPALNPNQPNHNIDAPNAVNVRLCG